MDEVRRIRPCGLRVASTFTGCGGSCLGFKMAGYTHVYASEFVPAARETYRANFPGVHLDDRDIRQVKPEDILAVAGLKVGELDVLEGSPPCASFSTAGKRSRDWGKVKAYSDVEQRTDDLFHEFVRLLRGLMPRAFVAENVSGLVKGVAKGYFIEIFRAMRAVGYRVGCQVLDAQWLGVPQSRQRTIFVGVREDLGRDPVFPRPMPWRYSIRDALPWISDYVRDTKGNAGTRKVVDVEGEPAITIGHGNSTHYRVRDQPIGFAPGTAARRARRGARGRFDADAPSLSVNADGIGGVARHQVEVRAPMPPEGDAPSISAYAIGPEWEKLRPGETSDRYFNLVRPDPDAPLPTVTQLGGANPGVASVTHPTEPRKFSIAELRRLCAFPDDFILTGSYAQQWERLGRAVPPLMMRAVAATLRDEVLLPAAGRSPAPPPPPTSPQNGPRRAPAGPSRARR